MNITNEKINEIIDTVIRSGKSCDGRKIRKKIFSKNQIINLVSALNTVSHGLRAVALLDSFPSCHGTLIEVLNELNRSFLQNEFIGYLSITDDASFFLVHKVLLRRRVIDFQFPVLLDVGSANSVMDGTDSLGTTLMEVVYFIFESEHGKKWLNTFNRREALYSFSVPTEMVRGVGLCGVVGWLLEYPIVYCAEQVMRKNNIVKTNLQLHTIQFIFDEELRYTFSFSSPSSASKYYSLKLIEEKIQLFKCLMQRRILEMNCLRAAIVEFSVKSVESSSVTL